MRILYFRLNWDGNPVDKAFVKEVIRTLGLEEKCYSLPSQLSGGQQQRVAIARHWHPSLPLSWRMSYGKSGFCHESGRTKPDEDTSQRYGQTMVMITHNEGIAQLSDRIIRIEDGKVRGKGGESHA